MANLKDISTVPELTALEGTEKLLLNVDGSAKQAAVSLVETLRDVSTLPVLESSDGTEKVLVNVGGVEKQVSAEVIAPKRDVNALPEVETLSGDETVLLNVGGVEKQVSSRLVKNEVRELVYEFTPGVDSDGNPVTDVDEFIQNIDDDLTWLATKCDNVGWEIVVTCYGIEGSPDGDGPITLPDMTITGATSSIDPYIGYFSDPNFGKNMRTYLESSGVDANGWYSHVCVGIDIYSGVQMDMNTGEPIFVENGGVIMIFNDDCNPIKSIQIYKITK